MPWNVNSCDGLVDTVNWEDASIARPEQREVRRAFFSQYLVRVENASTGRTMAARTISLELPFAKVIRLGFRSGSATD
jgi:hypothetical protein